MIQDNIEYAIEQIRKERDELMVYAKLIEEKLIECGVNPKGIFVAIRIEQEGMGTYLRIIPFHGYSNAPKFNYDHGWLNGEPCYTDDDFIYKVVNKVRRYMQLHPEVNTPKE